MGMSNIFLTYFVRWIDRLSAPEAYGALRRRRRRAEHGGRADKHAAAASAAAAAVTHVQSVQSVGQTLIVTFNSEHTLHYYSVVSAVTFPRPLCIHAVGERSL